MPPDDRELGSFDVNPYAAPQVPIESVHIETTRDGAIMPPWEDRGPIATRFVKTVSAVLQRTEYVFKKMSPNDLQPALLYYLLCVVMAVVLAIAGEVVTAPMRGEALGTEFLAAWGFGAFVGVVINLATLFITGVYMHVGMIVLRGASQPLTATMRAVAYALGTTNLLGLIPMVGRLLTIAGTVYIVGLGTAKVHGTATWKGVVLMCLWLVLVIASAFAAMAGLSATGVDISEFL